MKILQSCPGQTKLVYEVRYSMFEKLLKLLINQKFAGQECMFCPRLYEDIMFMPNNVRTCCFSTKMPYNPPVLFKRFIKNFDKKAYLLRIYLTMLKNQGKNAPCKGCKFFELQTVPWFEPENNIKFLTINHFTDCNANCIYCIYGDIVNKNNKKPHKILPVIKQMYEAKMINEHCLINWGGGEPVIYKEFPELVTFFRKHKIRQAVNSSGVAFSTEVWDGLRDGSVSIQISPDSGTPDGYYKIKRRNHHNKVWSNIAKYAVFPDMVFVKYIFFSLTADENEVREFINNCVKAGVKNIVIDCESESSNNPEGKFGDITDEIVKLACLMKNLAKENGLNYQISYQWRKEHREMIENR